MRFLGSFPSSSIVIAPPTLWELAILEVFIVIQQRTFLSTDSDATHSANETRIFNTNNFSRTNAGQLSRVSSINTEVLL